MKNRHKELDVDFIGGQKSMTKEEELAISAFIKANKAKQNRRAAPKATANTVRGNKQLA